MGRRPPPAEDAVSAVPSAPPPPEAVAASAAVAVLVAWFVARATSSTGFLYWTYVVFYLYNFYCVTV